MNILAQIIAEADEINVHVARAASDETFWRWRKAERSIDSATSYLTHVTAFSDYIKLDNLRKGIY